MKRPGQARQPARGTAQVYSHMVGTGRKSGRAQGISNAEDGLRIRFPGHTNLAGKTRAASWQEHPQLLEPTEHNKLLVKVTITI